MIKGMDLETRLPDYITVVLALTVWPQMSFLTSMCFSFLVHNKHMSVYYVFMVGIQYILATSYCQLKTRKFKEEWDQSWLQWKQKPSKIERLALMIAKSPSPQGYTYLKSWAIKSNRQRRYKDRLNKSHSNRMPVIYANIGCPMLSMF